MEKLEYSELPMAIIPLYEKKFCDFEKLRSLSYFEMNH